MPDPPIHTSPVRCPSFPFALPESSLDVLSFHRAHLQTIDLMQPFSGGLKNMIEVLSCGGRADLTLPGPREVLTKGRSGLQSGDVIYTNSR